MIDPLNFVQKFIDEVLNGDIEKIKTFTFIELDEKSEYRKTTDDTGHVDDSEIVRSIFYLIWKDKLPNLNNYDEIGTGKYYRGDTINTFNTIFGKEEESFPRLNKFCNDDALIKTVTKQFYKEYLTIGNFMLLPAKSIKLVGSSRATTLNFYRGNYFGLRDYFDKFLYQLELCLTESKDYDPVIMELVKENDFYFAKNKVNSIEKFCELNYLEPYFDLVGLKGNIFGIEPSFIRTFRNPTEEEKNKYGSYIQQYMTKVTEIINYRADKIVEELKALLNEKKE